LIKRRSNDSLQFSDYNKLLAIYWSGGSIFKAVSRDNLSSNLRWSDLKQRYWSYPEGRQVKQEKVKQNDVHKACSYSFLKLKQSVKKYFIQVTLW